jgi:uncharacterized RDD family membrane protein YckC
MDQILDAPIGQEKTINYAGFWIRVGAYIIDGILLMVIQLVISYVIFGGYSFTEPNRSLSIISILIGVVYFAGMESSARQATLGKILLGLKVGDAQGNKITFGNAVGRYFAKILSALILFIGFMMIGWDAKKQGLHDKLASTYVFEA